MAAPSSSRRQIPKRCHFYDKGWCKSGEQCRFIHEQADNDQFSNNVADLVAAGECKFYAKGKCTKGQNCHFLHSRSSASDGYQRGKAHERTPQIPDRPAKRSKSRAVTATASSTNATGTSLCGCSYSSSRGDDFDSGGGLPTTTGRFIATSGGGIGPCGGSSCEGETPIYNASYEDAEGNTGHSMTAAAAARNTAAARSAVSFRDALIGLPRRSSSSAGSREDMYDGESIGRGSPAASAARALLASVMAESGMATTAATRAAKSVELAEAAVQSALSAPRVARRKPCTFYVRGLCKFGDACRHSHDTEPWKREAEESKSNREPSRRFGFGVGVDDREGEEEWMESDEDAQAAGREAALDEEERLQARRSECGVCLERVRDKFGIPDGCKHVYCLKCIREWREKSNNWECPQCRVPSQLVVPSDKLIIDPARKERLILDYKKSLAEIPCQHFQIGVSECPFGSSCFYAHLKPDGSLAQPPAPAEPDSQNYREGSEDSLGELMYYNLFPGEDMDNLVEDMDNLVDYLCL